MSENDGTRLPHIEVDAPMPAVHAPRKPGERAVWLTASEFGTLVRLVENALEGSTTRPRGRDRLALTDVKVKLCDVIAWEVRADKKTRGDGGGSLTGGGAS